jgi:sporulation protein YlmC with PRC-barrel domain
LLFYQPYILHTLAGCEQLVLLSGDIRDILPQGFAVNDHEVLTEAKELIRLKEVLELRFELLGLKVTSESGKNYGKINDFAYETNNLFVQKLYVSQSIVKNFSGGTLSVDRSQIIEVTNRRIIIEDPTEPARGHAQSAGVIG